MHRRCYRVRQQQHGLFMLVMEALSCRVISRVDPALYDEHLHCRFMVWVHACHELQSARATIASTTWLYTSTVVGVHTHSFKTHQCDSSSSMKPVEIPPVSTPRAKHLHGCISHHQQIQVLSLYVTVFIHGPHQPQSRATFLQFFCFASPPTPVSSPYGLSSLYLHDNPIYREITKQPRHVIGSAFSTLLEVKSSDE